MKLRPAVLAVVLCMVSLPRLYAADGGTGSIAGRVTDSGGGVLPGAIVTLAPNGGDTVTDRQGDFAIVGLPSGDYTLRVSYIGFNVFTKDVDVHPGEALHVNPTLDVAAQSSSIFVTAERPRGEAEQINRQRTADNVLQVLTAEVITSLPNANIADALGRLPSVTLERDEGEGKYVQIRGTEPRLSNLTIDGVNVPSPEPGVRQIKLDTIASDLVESVEINKTLQANMDGDGIAGSVNLRTKTAGDQPALMLSGVGGYTPIIGGRGVSQVSGTFGERFGADKRVGALIGGTYDWNGRGINDIEPSPTVSSLSPHYDAMDLRDYQYYRTRWGLTGSGDYRMSERSSLFLRGLYSTFRNWGQKWVYGLNDEDVPSASVDWRRPDYAVGSVSAGGRHTLGLDWLTWDVSASRSRMLQSGGNGGANFKWNGADTDCRYDAAATGDPYRPQFSPSCFAPGTANTIDIANYRLSKWQPVSVGQSSQLNLQASASYGIQYHAGAGLGTLEFGAKFRNGHKSDDSYSTEYVVKDGVTIPIAQFAGTFTDPKYYDQSYPWPDRNVDYERVSTFVAANPDLFDASGGPGPNEANFDLTERVAAAYVMNTVDLSARARLVAGVRFESTHVDTRSFNNNTGLIDFKAGGNYVDALPSVALKFATSHDSNIRFVVSRALARPDPQDLAQAVSPIDDTQTPHTVSLGNPNLKAEHANNVDILFEQYLKPLGLIQAGYFYKYLTDPIVATESRPTTGPYAGFLVSQPGNAGSATLQGFEVSYTQHWGSLPGLLAGLGLSANYSYTTSEARDVPLRADHPKLLRQAPHTWNLSPTYYGSHVSFRLGVSYNAAGIYAYQYQNLNSDGSPIPPDELTAGGPRGPGGDIYLYPHLQVDMQGTVSLTHAVSVVAYVLNANNEVFGFYNGSPNYVLQREFYKPTFAVGVRLNSLHN